MKVYITHGEINYSPGDIVYAGHDLSTARAKAVQAVAQTPDGGWPYDSWTIEVWEGGKPIERIEGVGPRERTYVPDPHLANYPGAWREVK